MEALDQEVPVTPAKQMPFSVIVEWRAGATEEEMEEANKEISKLMNDISTMPAEDVLPSAIERLTVKRV